MDAPESYAYSLGRKVATLEDPFEATDSAFGSTRLDARIIQHAQFSHCTFVNVSFKQTVIQDSTFLDCIFVDCYFRRAELKNSSFVGCRFLDCHFGYVAIERSQFDYSSFRGCQLPFAELRHCLPPQHNLREALARNLSLESSQLGLSSESRQYRKAEIKAREAHLRAAFVASSKWYRDHFDLVARIRAGIELVVSVLNGVICGYGERTLVLLINLLVLSLLVFPVAFYVAQDGLLKIPDEPISLKRRFPSASVTSSFRLRRIMSATTSGLVSIVWICGAKSGRTSSSNAKNRSL